MADIILFLVHFLTGGVLMTIGYLLGRKDGRENAFVTIRYNLRAKVEKAAIIALGASVTEIVYNPLAPDDIQIKGIIHKPVKEFNDGI